VHQVGKSTKVMRGTCLAAKQLPAYQRLALRGIRQFSYLCARGWGREVRQQDSSLPF